MTPASVNGAPSVVISAESLFTLLDLCGPDPEAATATLRETAVAVVAGS